MSSRYERMYLEALEALNPAEHRRVLADPERRALVTAKAERAQEQFETLLAGLRRQHKEKTHPLEQAQHIAGLANQANEMVRDELMAGLVDDGP